ncbi:phospholipid carrier-dependent glycosyltransferase [Eubacteriales bacterium OttesenSCG-928-K08]|nr:phospholipid carrier-dependent glycosyltransferase [Eubacteriales bacterium OttesenSCG-928-K08]
MRKRSLIVLLAFLLLFSVSAFATQDSEPTLYNGDFSIFYEESQLPDGWYFDAWEQEFSNAYTVSDGASNFVVLENMRENDARVCQRIEVEPNTCYRFTCDVFVERFEGQLGATLSILDSYASSDAVSRMGQWHTIVLDGVTSPTQTQLTLALRLGGYGALSKGSVTFKSVTMEKLENAPVGAQSFAGFTMDDQSGDESAKDEPPFAFIVVATVLCALLAYLFYSGVVTNNRREALGPENKRQYIIAVFSFAFVLRMIFSILFVGHSTDISCFQAWSIGMQQHGPAGFYTSGMFADYPPGYMYVLWMIGALRELLGISYQSGLFVLMLKLPSIAADFVTAAIAYRLAKQAKMTESNALLIMAVFALNPVFAFLSGGWGQIDSLLTLCMFAAIYLFIKNKRVLAGAVYGLAILLKPQALMLGPLLAIAYFVPDKKNAGSYFKQLIKAALAVLSALAVIFLLALPFSNGWDMRWLLEKYFSTATSYPYASIEAFNLPALFGGNWTSVEDKLLFFSYGTWGTIGIVLSVVGAGALYIKAHKNNPRGALYIASAFLFAALFTLGQYMHERYLFPALPLLLFAAIEYDDKRLYGLFGWFSVTLLLNSLCAFYIVDYPYSRGTTYEALTFIGSLLTVAGFVLLCISCVSIVFKGQTKKTALVFPDKPDETDEQADEKEPAPSGLKAVTPYARKLNYTKKDKLFCWGLTAIYAVFALTNLGSLKAPQTEYYSYAAGESTIITLEENTLVSEVWIFGGIAQGDWLIKDSSDNVVEFEQKHDHMFRWQRVPINLQTDSLTFVTSWGELRIREIAIFADGGQRLIPVSATGSGVTLIDEQSIVPERPSYINGMYFDELYHARTAYEHLNGLEPYENSHPPLGKVFIMLGVAVFGMNAFGWRIVGALFGVAMVPIFYAFGKRIFKNSNYALLVTTLFTFDFMHFTQTRIATIDVYAVFFIILMYYYMYQYCCMNFYVDGLKATLHPLGLAGLFFGLGAASKWICIYAGAGLAVLLFISLFRRYGEYRKYKDCEDEALRQMVSPFVKNTILTLLWCCLFYIAIPVVIYLASYAPYYLCEKHYTLMDVWKYQEFMWGYHSQLTATHPYQSAWWQWPFTLRPMWYYWNDGMPEGWISTLTASGNPAVWWVCTVGMLALLTQNLRRMTRGRQTDDLSSTVITVGAAANFLPWVLVTRCTFIYHFFATVPFIVLGSAQFLHRAESKNPDLKWVKWVWMGLAVLLFLLLYPGLSGLEIPLAYAKFLKWIPGGGLMYGA